MLGELLLIMPPAKFPAFEIVGIDGRQIKGVAELGGMHLGLCGWCTPSLPTQALSHSDWLAMFCYPGMKDNSEEKKVGTEDV